MRADVAKDLSRSQKIFTAVVWPRISKHMGGGELVPVESVTTTDMSKALDVYAGVDGWQLQKGDSRMRGIASRVQWVDGDPFNTFTIRYSRTSGVKTEYEKRLHAIDSGGDWLYPALTVQAYVETGTNEFLSAGIVKTRDLIKYAQFSEGDQSRVQKKTNHSDGTMFLIIPWESLAEDGVKIKVVENNTTTSSSCHTGRITEGFECINSSGLIN